MEFGPSKEQQLLIEGLSGFLKKNAGQARIREFITKNEKRAQNLWEGLSELELPGLLVAEEHGGAGLPLIDAALVAESLGYFAAPVPFVASAVMLPLALSKAGSKEQQAQWLPQIAKGSVVGGAALTEAIHSRLDAGVTSDGSTLSGKALFVLDFEADVYLVADQDKALYLVDAEAKGVTRKLLPTIDRTRPVGELILDKAKAELLPKSSDPEICGQIIDAGRIILSADTLGAAQSMLNKAVAYSMERKQFGRVIGSFQAVKHMCAEMAADLEPCRSMMWYAAHAFDAVPDEAKLTSCHTKAHISEVGTFVAKRSTEVHGGIGFTDELGLHFWFKRIGANRQLLGGPERVREEAAQLQQLVQK